MNCIGQKSGLSFLQPGHAWTTSSGPGSAVPRAYIELNRTRAKSHLPPMPEGTCSVTLLSVAQDVAAPKSSTSKGIVGALVMAAECIHIVYQSDAPCRVHCLGYLAEVGPPGGSNSSHHAVFIVPHRGQDYPMGWWPRPLVARQDQPARSPKRMKALGVTRAFGSSRSIRRRPRSAPPRPIVLRQPRQGVCRRCQR